MKNIYGNCWNNIDSEIPHYSVENLSQCYSVHQKSLKDWPRNWANDVGTGKCLQESDLFPSSCERAKRHILRYV
jgi:hypothetical protein